MKKRRRGTGNDENRRPSIPVRKNTAGNKPADDVLFIRDIKPARLKRYFKAYASKRGTTMKALIVAYMKECCEEDGVSVDGNR